MGFEIAGVQPTLSDFIPRLNVILDKFKLRAQYPFILSMKENQGEGQLSILNAPEPIESTKALRKRIEKAFSKQERDREISNLKSCLESINSRFEVQEA